MKKSSNFKSSKLNAKIYFLFIYCISYSIHTTYKFLSILRLPNQHIRNVRFLSLNNRIVIPPHITATTNISYGTVKFKPLLSITKT